MLCLLDLLHVDAGLARSGIGGLATAVCRDSGGNYLGSSVLVIPVVWDVATLGAIACREALSLPDDLLVHDIVVATGSKQVSSDISKGCGGSYGQIISEIRLRATEFNCNFCFEGRASNYEALMLAKYAHSLDQGHHVWLGQPHDPLCIPNVVIFE